MALASSSTRCLRTSNRVTAIDIVNPRSRASTARMPPSIASNWELHFLGSFRLCFSPETESRFARRGQNRGEEHNQNDPHAMRRNKHLKRSLIIQRDS